MSKWLFYWSWSSQSLHDIKSWSRSWSRSGLIESALANEKEHVWSHVWLRDYLWDLVSVEPPQWNHDHSGRCVVWWRIILWKICWNCPHVCGLCLCFWDGLRLDNHPVCVQLKIDPLAWPLLTTFPLSDVKNAFRKLMISGKKYFTALNRVSYNLPSPTPMIFPYANLYRQGIFSIIYNPTLFVKLVLHMVWTPMDPRWVPEGHEHRSGKRFFWGGGPHCIYPTGLWTGASSGQWISQASKLNLK